MSSPPGLSLPILIKAEGEKTGQENIIKAHIYGSWGVWDFLTNNFAHIIVAKEGVSYLWDPD